MKRLLLTLCIFTLLSGVAMADFTSHPRYAVIDTMVKALITKIQVAQATYFAANQKYFQGIITPSTPSDGMTDTIPNWNVTPSDQVDSWRIFDATTFKTNFKIPFQIRIDVYESPKGWGWRLTIDVWKSGLDPDSFGTYGDHWVYRHHEGPDTYGSEYLDKWFIMPDEVVE